MAINPNMPPELLKVMIDMSGNPEEKEQLALQMAMAKMVGETALNNERAPSGTVGGIGHVISKGLLGYKSGADQIKINEQLKKLKERSQAGRNDLMRAIYGEDGGPSRPAFGKGMGGGLDVGDIGNGMPDNPAFPYDPEQPPI
jgi:hypothetical protein